MFDEMFEFFVLILNIEMVPQQVTMMHIIYMKYNQNVLLIVGFSQDSIT